MSISVILLVLESRYLACSFSLASVVGYLPYDVDYFLLSILIGVLLTRRLVFPIPHTHTCFCAGLSGFNIHASHYLFFAFPSQSDIHITYFHVPLMLTLSCCVVVGSQCMWDSLDIWSEI